MILRRNIPKNARAGQLRSDVPASERFFDNSECP